MKRNSHLKPGTAVFIKPAEAILATLDGEGTLDGLPFMPEMLACCGQPSQVASRVEATCVLGSGLRRFPAKDVVVLEGLRCTGRHHQNCQVGCVLFWKEAWLSPEPLASTAACGTNEELLASRLPVRHDTLRHFCQSTALRSATEPLSLSQRLLIIGKRLLRGDVPLLRLARFGWPTLFWYFATPLYRRAKEVKDWLRGSSPSRRSSRSRQDASLDLQPGDLVQVRSKHEIQQTLDGSSRSGGLSFTVDMVPYCGGTYRVSDRIQTIIRETDGELVRVRNTVSLAQVTCQGLLYCGVCPREHYLWWRETWLKRVEGVV